MNCLAFNVENNLKRNKLLSKRLFQRNKCNFLNEKMPRIQTHIDKITRKFRILEILCTFCQFFGNLCGLECQRQITKNFSDVREASLKRGKQFVLRKCIKVGPNMTKYLKIQIFETFMQFLCTFRKTWWLRILKTFNKEQIGCQEGFFKEIITNNEVL